jgi:glycosyltransferase involved in cell wall biosynthesis
MHGDPTDRDTHLRVAYVVSSLEVGGLQRSIATIAHHLDRDRAHMEVVALRRPSRTSTEMYDELGATGVTVHDLDVSGRAERDPRALATAVTRLRRLFVARRYDIVDSATIEADLSSRLATTRLGVSHVTHLISLTYDPRAAHGERTRNRWRPAAARWVDRTSGRMFTDRFVAITHGVARSAEQTLDIAPEKISVVERGVDAQRFRLRPIASGPVLRVLSVGRLEPSKDQATAVRAIAALRRRGVECTLTIAGRGPLQHDLERIIAEHDLGDHVHIVEPVTDVEHVYAAHDVLLFPSRWEGLGNATLEAMACGLPVVATDLDTLQEVLGPLGRYAPVGRDDQFAAQLAGIAEMTVDERTTLAHALRQRAIDRFDPAETTQRLLEVYEAVRRPGARRR